MPETPAAVARYLHDFMVVQPCDLNAQHFVARLVEHYFNDDAGIWLRDCSPDEYHAALIAADELHAPRERAVGEELR